LQAADRDLVRAFIEHGDEEAFRALFRRHTPRLYATARRLTGGTGRDAEDVVQSAWLRAARQLRDFEWRSALSTWLTGIVINCARELRRARPGGEVSAAVLEHQPAPARAGIGLDLDRAIAALPDGYREVLVLHDVEGMTHTEIAAALGIAAGTSKSQLFHARRAVRRWLRPRELSGVRHDG
jgi:RNA polymerase sigma-70 factor (ECF subfamily)